MKEIDALPAMHRVVNVLEEAAGPNPPRYATTWTSVVKSQFITIVQNAKFFELCARKADLSCAISGAVGDFGL